MRTKPSLVAVEIAYQKGKSGLALTEDQYDKLMRSAALADETMERKKKEREAECQALKREREAS